MTALLLTISIAILILLLWDDLMATLEDYDTPEDDHRGD